jgi:hypothetical protein
MEDNDSVPLMTRIAALCLAVATTTCSGTVVVRAASSTVPYSQHMHLTCRTGFRCKIIRLRGCTLRGKVTPTWQKITNRRRCSYTFSFSFFAQYNGRKVRIDPYSLRCSIRSMWPRLYKTTISCPPKAHNQSSPAVASTVVDISVYKRSNGANYFFEVVPVVNARGKLIHRFVEGSGCPPKLCG